MWVTLKLLLALQAAPCKEGLIYHLTDSMKNWAYFLRMLIQLQGLILFSVFFCCRWRSFAFLGFWLIRVFCLFMDKKPIRNTLNHKSYGVLVPISLMFNFPEGTSGWCTLQQRSCLQHDCRHQTLHVLPCLSSTHKTVFSSLKLEGRNIWHTLETLFWKCPQLHLKAQNTGNSKVCPKSSFLDPSDSRDIALALFPRTSIRFNTFQSHLSPKPSSLARLQGVTEGISYLLDVSDIPHPQLTVSAPSDQTLLFGYQSHPPNLSRGTMWGIGLWFL